MTTPSIVVPDGSHVGEPFPIALSGFSPRARITVRVSATDGYDRPCYLEREIETDRNGEFTLEESGETLLWNLSPPGESAPPFFVAADTPTFPLEVEVLSDSRRLAAVETTRTYVDPDVDVRSVTDPAVGTVFEPAGDGPFPGVIVLHGSDPDLWQNLPERTSIRHLLATRGYAVLSLRYIGEETPDPEGNFVTSLDYLESAIDWFRTRPAVADEPLGVVGTSRGGEGALQMGASFDAVGGVVAYVPSVYRFPWPVEGNDETAYWGDEEGPLPYVPPYVDERERSSPDQFRTAIVAATERQRRDARIPVTEIGGPVLFVSGIRDSVWPSTYLSEIGVSHLVADGATDAVRHLAFDDAGHGILAPYRDYSRGTTLGGTERGTARAAAQAWPRVLRTLDAATDEAGH